MKTLLGIIFLLAALPVFSQAGPLNGAWILTAIRHDNSFIVSDSPDPDPYRWTLPNTHWLFKEKKLYEINYPCCLEDVCSVTEKGNNAYIKTEGGQEEMLNMDFRNDSLILTSEFPYGATYYLIKDSIPVKELIKYTSNTINPLCLYGDWDIPVGEVPVPFDAITIWYPWKLPEKIHIDEKNLHHYWANNRLYLEVDGVKRPFRVKTVSLTSEDLVLTPESWVEEYIRKHKLYRYEVESVWLRKREED
ncbi:MAG: hypothetical protein ACO1N0_14540 [Fluviicola sp.]